MTPWSRAPIFNETFYRVSRRHGVETLNGLTYVCRVDRTIPSYSSGNEGDLPVRMSETHAFQAAVW
jgi:hypothetical protein